MLFALSCAYRAAARPPFQSARLGLWPLALLGVAVLLTTASVTARAAGDDGWPISGAYEPAPVTLQIAHGLGAKLTSGTVPSSLPIFLVDITVAPRLEFRRNAILRVSLDDKRVTCRIVRQQDPDGSDPVHAAWAASVASLDPACAHVTAVRAYFDNATVEADPGGAYTADLIVPVGATGLKRLEIDYGWLGHKRTFTYGQPASPPGVSPMALTTPLIAFVLFQLLTHSSRRLRRGPPT